VLLSRLVFSSNLFLQNHQYSTKNEIFRIIIAAKVLRQQ
jgi:hypothetical protein